MQRELSAHNHDWEIEEQRLKMKLESVTAQKDALGSLNVDITQKSKALEKDLESAHDHLAANAVQIIMTQREPGSDTGNDFGSASASSPDGGRFVRSSPASPAER